MIEVSNTGGYYSYILKMVAIILLGLIIVILFKPQSYVACIVIFIIVITILLFKKYTTKIIATENTVVIEYFRFLSKQKISISCADIRFELHKKVEFRGGVHFILQISKKQQILHTVDSRDGFLVSDLETLTKFPDSLRV